LIKKKKLFMTLVKVGKADLIQGRHNDGMGITAIGFFNGRMRCKSVTRRSGKF
jgi:hypothetical protein